MCRADGGAGHCEALEPEGLDEASISQVSVGPRQQLTSPWKGSRPAFYAPRSGSGPL